MAALFTSTSRRPWSASTSFAAAATLLSSVTSRMTGRAPSAAAAGSTSSGLRPASSTVMPRAASCAAISRPMPLLAPVTRAMVVSVMTTSPPAREAFGQDQFGTRLYPDGIAEQGPVVVLHRQLALDPRAPADRRDGLVGYRIVARPLEFLLPQADSPPLPGRHLVEVDAVAVQQLVLR